MTKTAVETSLCINPGQDTSYLENLAQGLPYPVYFTTLPWEEAWRKFTDFALHRQGADISQVGAPLVGDLVAMNALLPFTTHEMDRIGGEAAFDPASWQSASRVLHGQVWAIPWTADPRLIFYWQDLLPQAGVDPDTAFQDLEQMDLTLAQLKSSGIETPWALPIENPLAALQTAASWVWGAGGEFIRPDGRRTLFCEPPALVGWRRYFDLHRFMPRDRPLQDEQVLEMFLNRQVAVTMGSLYLGNQIWSQVSLQDHPKVGVALPPGPSLVGGSSLVVWVHTRCERDAKALAEFLVSPEIMSEHCQRTGYLPTRLDALSRPPFNTDSRFKMYNLALQSGKPFPAVQVGGLLENSLAASLVHIWQTVMFGEVRDINAIIEKHLHPLGRRLDITLSQF